MNICQLIDSLLQYGLKNNLIDKLDYEYSLNALLSILKLDSYDEVNQHEEMEIDDILEGILNYAIDNNIIENTTESKDLFDSKVMGVLTPKPSEIIRNFYLYLNEDSKKATDYFYKLCKDVNYIRSSRIAKDIHFDYQSSYGTINISINMSKPEKDPNDIKKLLTLKPVCYPKCMLCKENVNYQGRIGFPARQNLRFIPLTLANEKYFIQYSPYSYYNEHLICFHDEHFNMRINRATFEELIDFIDILPHYFIGSNAGLPIVGGSILNHQHFQGGKAILPMENATENYIKKINDVDVYRLNWPMSVIRLKSTNKQKIVDVATSIFNNWQDYENKDLYIINSKDDIHNTITPIVRYKNNMYEFDLVLRNNITSESRPNGVFHPRSDYWHIKKENIGLIEVMGLAILPSRLKSEMAIVKKYLLNECLTNQELAIIDKHLSWANSLKENNTINTNNVDDTINNGIGDVFVKVLKDCAIFKDENLDEFDKFILSVN